MAPAEHTLPKQSTAPERSAEQRREALKRANVIRMQRARLKRDLAGGRVTVYSYLLDPPDWLMTAKVAEILLAMPKYGRVKVNKALTQCRISASKTIGGLSPRQRDELVAHLQHRR
ncbi:MAG TPA: integration host factor, actinobacterial type [Solirubrobacteraceae bacterium]|nr:integration host factor, actinobacterial type [Solirubrobacteraceae bacterium]